MARVIRRTCDRDGALLAALVALVSLLATACSKPPAPPNVLFVLADDLRWDVLGSYGNRQIRTPNLDQLADEGMSLDAFYVASPICVASRINFLTGRHLIEEGISRRAEVTIEPDTETLADVFGRAGYRTGFIGKAHASWDPLELGFAEAPFYHAARRVDRPEHDRKRWVIREAAKRFSFRDVPGDPTEQIIDAAIDFVERNREDRWFLWLATTAPHYPYYSHPEHVYDPASLERPPGFPPNQELRNPELWQLYYQLVTHMDDQLGRLFATLDRLGLRDDTLVVFTSDNGIMHLSHGIRTKGVWHDESTRQPWIARWPGVIEAGTRADDLASSVDWLPTVRELLGVAAPERPTAGRSLLPLLRGGRSGRDVVFSIGKRHFQDGGGAWTMVRTSEEKFVRFDGDTEHRYYDLREDPFELEGEVKGQPPSESRSALVERLRHFRREFKAGRGK